MRDSLTSLRSAQNDKAKRNVLANGTAADPLSGVVRPGVANAAVIDLFAYDPKTDEVLLAMHEPRPWDGSDERLHQLQEKFNAYLSFLLDGEMTAAHPELAGKSTRIELRCDYLPDDRALSLLNLIHGQIALQEIKMEVIVAQKGGCGQGCNCQ